MLRQERRIHRCIVVFRCSMPCKCASPPWSCFSQIPMGHARCPYHSLLSASKTPWLRLVETRMMASFAKWPITSPMMIATCRRDPVSHRVEGAEQKNKNDHWCCVCARDPKLGKSIAKWWRRAKKNSICNLPKLVEMVYWKKVWSTYGDTNTETEQSSLSMV